jgi:hypothetical protein
MSGRYDHFANLGMLNDDAKSHAGPFDPCKTSGLIQRLVDILGRSSSGPAPCVGIFGPLGQGKTSLLKSLELILATRAESNGLAPLRMQWFDAAQYKPDDLEHEFDHLVMRWRFRAILWAAFIVLLVVVVSVSMGSFLLASWQSDPLEKLDTIWPRTAEGAWNGLKWLFGIGVVAFVWRMALGWTPLKMYWRDVQRSAAIGNWRDVKAISLGIAPDILVLDNLDRAVVTQQRAILRAIGKYRNKLAVPIIIAMDESALLAGSSDPEAPAELLRKVIDAELRMPMITPGDGAILVAAIAGEALINLRSVATSVLLSSPRTLGDIARIVQLTGIATPRRLKRLLNDAFQQAAVMGAHEPGDFGAILRLRALIELVPTLAAVPERIVSAMVFDDEGGFAQLLLEHSVKDPEPALALMRATRHLRPARGSWRVFIGQLSGGEAIYDIESNVTQVDAPPILQRAPSGIRKMVSDLEYSLAAVARGVQGEDWTAPLLAPQCPADRHTLAIIAWLTVETKLARMTDPLGRLRILQSLERNTKPFETNEGRENVMFRIDRLWLADDRVLGAMNQLARDALFLRSFSERAHLLTLVPPRYIVFLDRLAVASYVDTRLNLESIGTWVGTEVSVETVTDTVLFATEREVPDEDDAYNAIRIVAPSAILPEPIWPRLGGEEFGAELGRAEEALAWHLRAFRSARNLGLTAEPSVLQAAFEHEGFLERWLDEPIVFLDILDRSLFGDLPDDSAMEALFGRHLEGFSRLLLNADEKGVAWSARRIWRILPFFVRRVASCPSGKLARARDVILERLERLSIREAITIERFQALDKADPTLFAQQTPQRMLKIVGPGADHREIAVRLVQLFVGNAELSLVLERTIKHDPLPLRAIDAENPSADSEYRFVLAALTRCSQETRLQGAMLLIHRSPRTREEALLYLDDALDVLEGGTDRPTFLSLGDLAKRLHKRLLTARKVELPGVDVLAGRADVVLELVPDFLAFLYLAKGDPVSASYEIASVTVDLPVKEAERRRELEMRFNAIKEIEGVRAESPEWISLMDAVARRIAFTRELQKH